MSSQEPPLQSGPVEGGHALAGARLIGLTGGIACGKSALSSALAARGALIIDADRVARSVVAPGSEGLEALVARWGEAILSPEGQLDRAQLGALVFAAPEMRAELEAILHPLIAQESGRQIQEALSSDAALVVYDAALLIEAGRAEDFRPLVVVYASPETQLKRVMARDELSAQEVKQRLAAQMPAEEKARLADWLIINEGEGLGSLEPEVERLWSAIRGPIAQP